jgi:hypothetical protein
LGDATPDVGVLQSQANNLASQLVQINQRILQQQQQILQLSQSGVDMSAEGSQLLDARNQFEDAVSQFTFAYRALFGMVPPGLSGPGLGIDPGTLLTVAAILAAVATAVYIVIRILDENDANISLKQAQQANIATALTQGDTATAAAIAQSTNSSVGTDFFKNNWPWLVGGGVLLLVLLVER